MALEERKRFAVNKSKFSDEQITVALRQAETGTQIA